MAKEKLRRPSAAFIDAVTDTGTRVADCELCGRTIFENDEYAGGWEEGELEKLRKKAEENPDKYVGYTDRSVATGTINGQQVVTNCVCNELRRFEDWIWTHRHIIARYVERRTRETAERALRDEAEAEFLHESVQKTTTDRDVEFAKCQDCHGYFDNRSFDEFLRCPRCSRERATEKEKREAAGPSVPDPWSDDDNLPF